MKFTKMQGCGNDYVYVTYTRSDMSSTDAHNLQVQRLVQPRQTIRQILVYRGF